MSLVQVQYRPFSGNPYPSSDNRDSLNPIVAPNYSDITHNLVLAQENNSVNRMITQSTSTT
ncbi:hypothetical protein B9T07_21095 [Limnospira fusiformis CCALA 023]|uniref:Uncharacterized protein n=1 Tax=Limnospira indica PCC 8005 TaxID=376219 RepID=A0A9P1KH13_9CYAN|nr:hypothetical protein APPUASWS_023110 [Arthrospira platensis str. Paraca]CDM96146.1 hypothetical protein ARTHRO_40552 [Limnospira indica PCC 8005]